MTDQKLGEDVAQRGPDRSKQGERLRATLLARLDQEYQGRTFDVVREVHLPRGQVYVTKFGSQGRHGWVIRDRESGEEQVVGWVLLKRIHDMYLGLTLPSRRRHILNREPRATDSD